MFRLLFWFIDWFFRFLELYDACSFYHYVENLKNNERTIEENSGWVYTEAAEKLFEAAKRRVFYEKTDAGKGNDSTIQRFNESKLTKFNENHINELYWWRPRVQIWKALLETCPSSVLFDWILNWKKFEKKTFYKQWNVFKEIRIEPIAKWAALRAVVEEAMNYWLENNSNEIFSKSNVTGNILIIASDEKVCKDINEVRATLKLKLSSILGFGLSHGF